MLVECRTCGAEIDAPINSALPMAQCGVCRQDGAVNDRERALATARDAEMYSASHERDLARQALDAANAEIERLKGQLSQAQSDRQRQNEQRCDASDAEIVTRLRDKATAIRAAASALAGMCVLDVETVRVLVYGMREHIGVVEAGFSLERDALAAAEAELRRVEVRDV